MVTHTGEVEANDSLLRFLSFESINRIDGDAEHKPNSGNGRLIGGRSLDHIVSHAHLCGVGSCDFLRNPSSMQCLAETVSYLRNETRGIQVSRAHT